MIEKVIAQMLRVVADKLDRGECDLTTEERATIMAAICHEPLSKEGACRYLNVSRATFDNMVRDGKLPSGKKRQGFKELVWYRDEIDNCCDFFSRK